MQVAEDVQRSVTVQLPAIESRDRDDRDQQISPVSEKRGRFDVESSSDSSSDELPVVHVRALDRFATKPHIDLMEAVFVMSDSYQMINEARMVCSEWNQFISSRRRFFARKAIEKVTLRFYKQSTCIVKIDDTIKRVPLDGNQYEKLEWLQPKQLVVTSWMTGDLKADFDTMPQVWFADIQDLFINCNGTPLGNELLSILSKFKQLRKLQVNGRFYLESLDQLLPMMSSVTSINLNWPATGFFFRVPQGGGDAVRDDVEPPPATTTANDDDLKEMGRKSDKIEAVCIQQIENNFSAEEFTNFLKTASFAEECRITLKNWMSHPQRFRAFLQSAECVVDEITQDRLVGNERPFLDPFYTFTHRGTKFNFRVTGAFSLS